MQVELAEVMGTDQSQISKFERRERRINVIDYLRFCMALQIDPGKLLVDASVEFTENRWPGGPTK